jgi:outer membrane lipoprotein-sorting protein
MRDGDKFLSHTVTTSTTTVLPGEDATEEEQERGGKQVDEEKVTTVCDGEAMWMYFEKGEQKGITKQATPLASNWEPTAAFASYRNFYEFTLDREDEHEGAACWVLKLAQVVPEGAPPTGDTELWYRQDCGLLVKSIVTDGTGAPMTTTVVSDLKLGEEIDRERFSFTPPEGIPVNDHTGAGGGN